MPNFQYIATDQTGAQTQGTFEAANEQQAYEQLAQYGLNVSQVTPLDPPPSSTSTNESSGKQKKAKGKKKKGLLALELGGGQQTRIFPFLPVKCPLLFKRDSPCLEVWKS